MEKAHAIRLLGGKITAAAHAVGVTPSAVTQWPDDLPPRIADRVLAALARKHLPPELIGSEAGQGAAIDATSLPPAPGERDAPSAADVEAVEQEAQARQ